MKTLDTCDFVCRISPDFRAFDTIDQTIILNELITTKCEE